MDRHDHYPDLGSNDQGEALAPTVGDFFGRLYCSAYFRAGGLPGQWSSTILLHGWGGSSRSWERFGRLVRGDMVICPDLRGFGDSPEAGLPPVFDQHVMDIAEIVARLAANGNVAIVGHSYGGLIAQQIAARYPDRVDALVLLSTQSRCRPFLLTKATRNLVMSIEDAPSRDAAIKRLIPSYYRADSLKRKEMQSLIEDACRASPRALRESLLSAAHAVPLDPTELRLFPSPVLALAGQYDILPTTATNEVAATFANGTGAIIPGAAHCAAYDQPFALAALVNQFLGQALARP